VLGPNVTLAHCVHLKSEEITKLAQHGCHVAHCPTSNLKLASGMAPIAQLLSEGVNVGIGTDGAASNNRLDMFAEMRLAALLAKGVANDATVVPANQVLAMATINAASALGLDQAIGSLEIGKLADIVAVDFSAAEMQPCYDPISHLIFVAGREHVSHTWVAGELLYQNGEFPKLNASGHDHTIFTEISASWQTKLKPFHL
jgi:5-methylthioadenosine/S-adenosylhomocysteine deaminase